MAEAITLNTGYYIPQMEQRQSQNQVASFDHSEAAFEQLFKTHFKALHAYAFSFVKDSNIAEDMVQNTFFKVWEKQDDIHIHTSLKAYLYRSVYHECLNYLKHQKVKTTYASFTKHRNEKSHENASQKVQMQELETKLERALSELPEQCRTVFQMSRFETLKYREIADQLNISIKTVENQMGKALRILRLKLVDFLPLLLTLLFLR